MTPLFGILLSLVVLTTLLLVASWLRRDLGAESSRKLVHLGCGGLALSFPWLFNGAAGVLAACGLGAGVLATIPRVGLVPQRIKDVIAGVERASVGEFYFPLAVVVVFALSEGDHTLYLIPLAILTLADTAAAMIGSRYGTTSYRAWRGTKSLEGSLAFFVVSLVTTYALVLVLTDLPASDRWLLAIAIALATTLTEALASGGADNLAVPVVAFVVLYLSERAGGSAWSAGLLLGLTATFLLKQRGDTENGIRSWAGRMKIYLAEMFPLPLRVVTAAVYVLGVTSMVRLGLGVDTSLWTRATLVGVGGVFCHLLLLRLMDELKDVEVDRELFADRPLPAGRVRETDIRLAMALAAVAFVVVNLAVVSAIGPAILLLFYSFLMFRFFFAPVLLREKLLLNLATHNPVVALVVIYLTALAVADHGRTLLDLDASSWLGLVAYFWPATLAWEIARKIRSRQEEDAYVTYSKIFGMRRAVAVVAAVQLLSVVVGIHFHRSLDLSWVFLAVLGLAFAISLTGLLRFACRPCPSTSQLRPWAEAFLFGVLAAPLLEHFIAGRAG